MKRADKAFLVLLLVVSGCIGTIIYESVARGTDAERRCFVVCGSEYAEHWTPRHLLEKGLCVCPPLGGDGPRGQHWTLAAADGGVP